MYLFPSMKSHAHVHRCILHPLLPHKFVVNVGSSGFGRISGSPVVTLSPNGRASRSASDLGAGVVQIDESAWAPAPAFPELQQEAAEKEVENARNEEVKANDDPSHLQYAAESHDDCSKSQADVVQEQPTAVRDTNTASEEEVSSGSDAGTQDKETWWECDYCSRAFASLDLASAHEVSCARNPAAKGSRKDTLQLDQPELRRLLSPGHLCSPILEASRYPAVSCRVPAARACVSSACMSSP